MMEEDDDGERWLSRRTKNAFKRVSKCYKYRHESLECTGLNSQLHHLIQAGRRVVRRAVSRKLRFAANIEGRKSYGGFGPLMRNDDDRGSRDPTTFVTRDPNNCPLSDVMSRVELCKNKKRQEKAPVGGVNIKRLNALDALACFSPVSNFIADITTGYKVTYIRILPPRQ